MRFGRVITFGIHIILNQSMPVGASVIIREILILGPVVEVRAGSTARRGKSDLRYPDNLVLITID